MVITKLGLVEYTYFYKRESYIIHNVNISYSVICRVFLSMDVGVSLFETNCKLPDCYFLLAEATAAGIL